MATVNTIKIKCYGEDITENRVANAAIDPGMLLEYTGSTQQVKAHATAGGNVTPILVALENDLEGEGPSDAYAASDQVRVWVPRRGDEGYLYLEDGENISIFDRLESKGNGRVQKHTADVESFESAEAGSITVYPNQIVAIALEAKNLSVSGSLGSAAESSAATGHQFIKVKFV